MNAPGYLRASPARRAARLLAAASVGLAATLVVSTCAGDDDSADPTTGSSRPADDPTTLVVDVDAELRPLNHGLSGIHAKPSADSIRDDFDDLAPRTHRHVMSAADFLHFDCSTGTVDQTSLDYFNAWLDAVDAEGADAILSLSFVPECVARDGQPKGPTTDGDVYRAFLDTLLHELLTVRAASGRRPLERLELWNEPDIPVAPGDPGTGHGFVGTLDEFVDTLLPHQVAAIDAVEHAGGVDLLVGTPAAYSPWPIRRFGDDLAEVLVEVNDFDPVAASEVAAAADGVFAEPHLPAATERVLDNGGFAWPRRIIDEAEALGLDIDFVSVHLYPNNPLQGAVEPGGAEPQLLRGRNPFASPDDFAELASRWSEEFPNHELFVSEWSLSAGSEWRHGTCEGAAFNAAPMSVMQDGSIDRALFLGRPPSPADAAMRTWAALPDHQVEATLPDGSEGIWVTAAHDDERTTVLVSQWHSMLTDARKVDVPVRVLGLDDGVYRVEVTWLGDGDPVVPGASSTDATSVDGSLELDDGITLAGQSVVRFDIRRADAEALTPLTEPAGDPEPGPCLPGST